MHPLAKIVCGLSLTVLLPSGARAQAPPNEDQLTLRPYLFKALEGWPSTQHASGIEAEWGVLKVPEDRSNPAGRTIELSFVRLQSTAREPGPPIVYLAGGPGSSGIESARGARLPLWLALREIGDVVLLDQRGTGSSRPSLICRDSWTYPYDAPLAPHAALATIGEKARACVETLKRQGHNLSAYNAREIADDLEDLRQALKAPRISLVATSYGTHLALAMIHRHESSIHRAALLGVVGPDHTLKLPAAIERGLRGIDELNVRASGTNLAEAIATVLARVEEPVTVTASDPLTGTDIELRVGKFDLQLATVRALGDHRSLCALREAYAKMLAGDFTPLARDFLAARKAWLGRAMPYAVLCASGVSQQRFQTVTEQERGSSLGRSVDFPFPEICSSLGVNDLGPELRAPVRSRVPVLLVSGTYDLRTPIVNAEEVLQGFPHGQHLIVEGAGHGDDLMVASPEIARNVVEFLRGQPVAVQKIAATPLWDRVLPPPAAEVLPVVETLHGVEISDPYRWLEAPDTPETRWWIEVQNRYADNLLNVLPGRQRLRQQLAELSRVEGVGRPWIRGERSFYSRRHADQDLASIVLRVDDEGEEQVLIDPATMSADYSESVRILDVADDGRLLVYGVQEGGADEIEVRLFDVGKRRPLADRLPRARYFGATLLGDNREMIYARETAPGQGARLYSHQVGTDPAADREIFGEGYGRGTIVWGNLSDDGRYLVAHALSGTTQRVDVYVRNLTEGGELIEVVAGVDATFYGGVLGEKLVLHSNWQAPRGRVLVADPENPGQDQWREIIPEHTKAVIRTVYGAAGRLFVEYLEDVRSRVAIFDLEGRELGEVPFPAIGSLDGIRGLWDQQDVYFSFSSFHVPPTIYRYDATTGKLEVWWRAEVPIDPDQFEIRQVWYPSEDGTQVPMFLIHPRALKLDGSHPTLLVGYGGFGTSVTPSFNEEIAAWIERGGVYAIANVRGGGELGEAWHQAAVREKKQNSFVDFIAAAEWLIERGYTRPEKLAISGHSNGGLLVAAAMTQRPELFRAVICSHALLDMLRYHKFLAARFWLPEYGSPDRPDAFAYLRAYSPYHRLAANEQYPAVFFLTGAGDTRVAPLHARKMTARMQTLATPDRPVVLRHHAQAGHSGQGITRTLRIDELTDTLSFLFWQLGEL